MVANEYFQRYGGGREVLGRIAVEARKNVATFQGGADNWHLVVKDAREGVDVEAADAVVIDVPDPVPLLTVAAAALRPGGCVAVYVPTVLQLKEVRDAFAGNSQFSFAETIEILERPWHADVRSLRPSHRMVAHTAFLTFARRTADGRQP